MIAVVQRVSAASVAVGLEAVGKIDRGLVALIGVSRDDTETDVNWLARKLTELRIFPDATGEKHFDLDVRAVGGAILLVSNFTIMAATHQGRRPSFDLAAGTEKGGQLFKCAGRSSAKCGCARSDGAIRGRHGRACGERWPGDRDS